MAEEQTPSRRAPTLREYHEIVSQLAIDLRENLRDLGCKLDIVVEKVDDARTRIAVLETQRAEVTLLRQENRDLRCELVTMSRTLTDLEVRVKTNAALISLAISAVLSIVSSVIAKLIH